MTTLTVDILKTELAGKLPHWLSPDQAFDRTAIRAKNRAKYLAERTVEPQPAKPETMARLQAAYMDARRHDPFVVVETGEQTTARLLKVWRVAIARLDESEVTIRDMIERELADKTGRRAIRAVAVAKRVAAKVSRVRDTAIKSAFRVLRAGIGNVTILGHSLAVWARVLAAADATSIRFAIQSGLIEGLDNAEIAVKVIGTMGMNGTDGVTEFTRHKVAHLGRAALRENTALTD